MAVRPVPDMYPMTQNYYGGFSAGLTGAAYHGGVDYGAPTGTPVVSPESGTVVFADWAWNLPGGPNDYHLRWYQAKPSVGNKAGGGGLMVVIRNAIGSHWLMAHLSAISVRAGQTVRPGSVVGKIGSTGLSTGPHLHLGLLPPKPVWTNGGYGAIDPLPYLTEPYRSLESTSWTGSATGGTGNGVTTGVSSLPTYKLEVKETPNYTGAKNRVIDHVVVHWWGDPKNKPTHDGIVSWLQNPSARVSAHYVVSRNRVTQLVHPAYIAWHAMNGNASSIGIELDPNDPGGTLPTAAALIRELKKTYTINAIRPHSYWVKTACPGDYSSRMARLEAMVRTGLAEDIVALSDSDVQKIVNRLLDTKLPMRGLEKYELTVRESLAWQGDSRNKVSAIRTMVEKIQKKVGA